jgi:Rrf2 family transcriptional regulator, iron-sulfur cluster assembly transcription factor
MKLTTRGRYAVTAIIDLALHQSEHPVTLADIAARQGISLAYLEQIFARLRRSGLVSSTRGPGGGYRLTRESRDIVIADIIDAVNESVEYTRCGGERNCQAGQPCLTHELWVDLGDRVREYLRGVTVADLLAEPSVQAVAARQRGEAAPLRHVASASELAGH